MNDSECNFNESCHCDNSEFNALIKLSKELTTSLGNPIVVTFKYYKSSLLVDVLPPNKVTNVQTSAKLIAHIIKYMIWYIPR